MGNNFDEKAATWDENPRRIELIEKVWNVIDKQLTLSKDTKVLDYGCGTGLLGYKFIDRVGQVTFCDTSQGMLEQVEKKRDFYGYENVKTLFSDFVVDDVLAKQFDLIVSMLVLHHVEDLDLLLKKLAHSLNDGGLFCWIDLDEEDGSFHSDNTGIHHFGFRKERVETLFRNNGFKTEFYSLDVEYTREREEGILRFPMFIAIGRKS